MKIKNIQRIEWFLMPREKVLKKKNRRFRRLKVRGLLPSTKRLFSE